MSDDPISHLRRTLRRWQTQQAADTQAVTEVGDGTAVRPEGRVRGSAEHLRDVTYVLEAAVSEIERQGLALSQLRQEAGDALRASRAEVVALAYHVADLRRWTVALGALLLGVGCAAGLALGLSLALWWRIG